MIETAFTADGLAPGGVVLHPRSYVEFASFIDGKAVLTGIAPNHVALHRGSHNKADECKITIDGTGLALPIRLIEGSEVAVYLGVAPDETPDQDIKDPKNLRHVGYVVEFEEDRQERTASLESQDLSYFCRRPKIPVRKTNVVDAEGSVVRTVDPTPRYSDSLRQAIERLLSILPEFSDSTKEPPLRLRSTEALNRASLSSLVGGRGKTSPIALKPDCTVWEAVEHLCGILGLHVKVDLREIVVRSSEEVFAGRASRATFIFGAENGNCYGPKFCKKPVHNRNGVRVVAFDPEARKRVEAIYPDDTTVRRSIVHHRTSATRAPTPTHRQHKKKPAELPPPPRDVYELEPAHYTQEALQAKAKAIWLERSRQECDGTVSTPIWTEEILQLQNADLITIKIDADIAREIERIGSDEDASQLLQERLGYEKAAADALVRAARKPSRDDWYCQQVTLEHPSEHLATVKFLNLLEV
jgi:hypothetical protein